MSELTHKIIHRLSNIDTPATDDACRRLLEQEDKIARLTRALDKACTVIEQSGDCPSTFLYPMPDCKGCAAPKKKVISCLMQYFLEQADEEEDEIKRKALDKTFAVSDRIIYPKTMEDFNETV